MAKINLQKAIKQLSRSIDKYSPEILLGFGITGMLSSVVMAVQATPKAMTIIEREKDAGVTELKPVDVVKMTWKCYIPTAIAFTSSAACLIGGNSIKSNRTKALAVAYSLSQEAIKDYQARVVETIGEKKEQAIRDSISEDKLKQNPVKSSEVIITKKGDTLCYDELSGRYFKSDVEKIKRAENYINHQMMTDMYASLNDFYDEIGLPMTKFGDETGWHIDDGLLTLEYTAGLSTDDEPCIVIKYSISPKHNFYHNA